MVRQRGKGFERRAMRGKALRNRDMAREMMTIGTQATSCFENLRSKGLRRGLAGLRWGYINIWLNNLK